MNRVPYNYQDIRDALESYLASPQSADDFTRVFKKLHDIELNANHYKVSRRAAAAFHVASYVSLYGLHDYTLNPYTREAVRRIAALGK